MKMCDGRDEADYVWRNEDNGSKNLSASEVNPRLLWYPNICDLVQNSLPLVPITN
jgi:hypothetical protein